MARATKKRFAQDINNDLYKLRIKNNYSNIFYIGMDWAIIVGSIIAACNSNSWIVYFTAIFLIGSRMRALENLLHNGSHGMLFANPTVNNLATKLFCAYPIFLSFNLYKDSHMDHHRWLGDKDKDPDYLRYQKLGIDQLPFTKQKMYLNLLRMFLLVGIPKYVYGTVANTLLHKDRNNELAARIIFLVSIGALISIFFSYTVIVKFWLVPYFTTFQIIRYLAEISEHGGLYGRSDKEVALARNNTATFMSFFIYPHNDNYHLIHHLFPVITHYKMPEAHAIMLRDDEYRAAHTCHGYFFNLGNKNQCTLNELIGC